MKNILGLVFVKNCLITAPYIFPQYELYPLEGLEWNDELNLIHNFLVLNQLGPLTNREIILQQTKAGQPVFVVCFKKLHVESEDEADQLMKSEVEKLNSTLSLFRGGYPQIIASVIKNLDTQEIKYKPYLLPSYRGNLLGGGLAGEDVASMMVVLEKIKINPSLDLYLALFREAILEEKLEISYFRLWNLLEILAKSKNFVGSPRKNWSGVVIKSSAGKELKIEDQAEQIVFELLRSSFSEMGFGEESFKHGLEQGNITEQIPIWYRHRNCAGHHGGCFPENHVFCDQGQKKFTKCREAHVEMVSKHGGRGVPAVDQYFTSLRETVKLLIMREFSLQQL
ncbi:MAG: hypothetical protein V1882_10405 [Candidatus Omnitrophota bacterium]